MEIEFDPAKDAANLAKHRVSLVRAADLRALHVEEDRRLDYREPRYRAFSFLDGLPHMLVFTVRGSAMWPISLRRSHLEEFRRYVS